MIEYRKAELSDIDELTRLRIEFLQEIGSIDPGPRDKELVDSLYDYFSERLSRDEFIAWLAIDGGRVAATSGLCFYNLPPSYKNPTGRVAYIMNMYTAANYRGRGIAKNLFTKIIESAKEKGYKYISLHATEMGKPLYLKFGFKDLNTEMTLKLE